MFQPFSRLRPLALMLASLVLSGLAAAQARDDSADRTTFQDNNAWAPETDLQTDRAMVYGVNATLAERIASWREHGYKIDLMTGISWGEYDDYVEGRFDGKTHHDEAQVTRDGKPILHGDGPIFYHVPTQSYRNYIKSLVSQAIDLGVEAVYLEEPEFWNRAGYSEGFKREWRAHYNEDWIAPHTSVDSRYRTSKLMQTLYTEALADVFGHIKQYGAAKGRDIKCYVPTHSLVSYSAWNIVSPMARLMASKEADGYIAQVWTGTARTPNIYNGQTAQRTFETAFLEYAQMISMVRPTGRTCYLLADPVEDNPNYGWDDYKANYERVLVASLLQPDEWHYEVMPWPSRIFKGQYFGTNADAARRDEPNPPARIDLPTSYGTTMLAGINALNEMKADPESLRWDSGTQRIGVLIADSIMYQRAAPSPSDPHLSAFFGLALPPLKHGMPIKVVQLETLTDPAALREVDVLLMTYEGMKPPAPQYHDELARWVREQGGGIIYADDLKDPFNGVREWWNEGDKQYAAPGLHLAEALGLGAELKPGLHKVGKGFFLYQPTSPTALAKDEKGAATVRGWLREVLAAQGHEGAWREQSHLVLRRGRYVIAANMNESVQAEPVAIPGRLAALFNPELPVAVDPKLPIGEVCLYVDLERCAAASVVASASRVRDEKAEGRTLTFTSRGPVKTQCATRLRLPAAPSEVKVTRGGQPVEVKSAWDEASGTVLLRYENVAAPLEVAVTW